ncbi:hypothetical protein AgCh_034994 [Apium graveolens]
MENIELIKIAAAKLESNKKSKKLDVAAVEQELDAKWKKIDEEIIKKFGSIEKKDKVFSHFSQLRQILANEMSLGNMERGQPSSIKSLKASVIFQPKRNYPKNSDKNPLNLSYETPRLNEKKLLARNVKIICVVAGYPQFVEAKKEEMVRLKQQQKQAALEAKNLAKNPATTEVTLPVVTTGNLDEGKKEEPKKIKRKLSYKINVKRKIDFDEDKEDYMPAQSTTTSQSVIPTVKEAEFKVDPNITFHGDPVIPKDEPID